MSEVGWNRPFTSLHRAWARPCAESNDRLSHAAIPDKPKKKPRSASSDAAKDGEDGGAIR